MNDGYESGVACPLCRRVLAPCTCKTTNPETGEGISCDGCSWEFAECFKTDIVTSIMARSIKAEHGIPEPLAHEIARTAFGSIVWGDCDRYHHLILGGQFALDRDRYTPRIDLSQEWDRMPTKEDQADLRSTIAKVVIAKNDDATWSVVPS